jgi:hypothetical protein
MKMHLHFRGHSEIENYVDARVQSIAALQLLGNRKEHDGIVVSLGRECTTKIPSVGGLTTGKI